MIISICWRMKVISSYFLILQDGGISLYGVRCYIELPTVLSSIVQVKDFSVISQIYCLDMFWVFSIEVANCTVAVDAQVQLLCYPRGSFYPISPVPPTKYTRITRSDFRLCLTCMSHSQASLCPCTIIPISIRN